MLEFEAKLPASSCRAGSALRHNEFAAMIGVTRSIISIELGKLKRELIHRIGRLILLADLARLRPVACDVPMCCAWAGSAPHGVVTRETARRPLSSLEDPRRIPGRLGDKATHWRVGLARAAVMGWIRAWWLGWWRAWGLACAGGDRRVGVGVGAGVGCRWRMMVWGG